VLSSALATDAKPKDAARRMPIGRQYRRSNHLHTDGWISSTARLCILYLSNGIYQPINHRTHDVEVLEEDLVLQRRCHALCDLIDEVLIFFFFICNYG
jgi:hypothetical protein